MSLTIYEALSEAQEKLKQAGILNSFHEARLLLRYALNFSLEKIIISPQVHLTPEQLEKYKYWITRRSLH